MNLCLLLNCESVNTRGKVVSLKFSLQNLMSVVHAWHHSVNFVIPLHEGL